MHLYPESGGARANECCIYRVVGAVITSLGYLWNIENKNWLLSAVYALLLSMLIVSAVAFATFSASYNRQFGYKSR